MPTILRSKRSDLVKQELYAILITYNLIRSLIKEAADIEGDNSIFISFLDTMHIIIEGVPHLTVVNSNKKTKALSYMLKMIGDAKIDRPRRLRCNSRVVKIKMSNFKRKRTTDKSMFRNFEEEIQIEYQMAA